MARKKAAPKDEAKKPAAKATKVEETPVKETPVKEEVVEETPVKETESIKETPVKEEAVEETPEKEIVEAPKKEDKEENPASTKPVPAKPKRKVRETPTKLKVEIDSILTTFKSEKPTKEDARRALNFITSLNIHLSDDRIDREDRIKDAQHLFDEVSKVKDLIKVAATVSSVWSGDQESFDAYVATMSLIVAKQNKTLASMPKNGIRKQFHGKFNRMGEIVVECS